MADDEQQATEKSLFERLDSEVRHAADREDGHRAAVQLLAEARIAHSKQQLSEADLTDFIYWAQVAWLRLRWGAGEDAAACPFCENKTWSLSESISLLSKEIGPISQHFGVSCTNCGQTVFVSAEQAGLLDPNELEARDE
jgi:hypothetical protein